MTPTQRDALMQLVTQRDVFDRRRTHTLTYPGDPDRWERWRYLPIAYVQHKQQERES